jgi:hypothetical protein
MIQQLCINLEVRIANYMLPADALLTLHTYLHICMVFSSHTKLCDLKLGQNPPVPLLGDCVWQKEEGFSGEAVGADLTLVMSEKFRRLYQCLKKNSPLDTILS